MGTGGGPGAGIAQWREALADFDRWRTRPTNRAGPGMFVIAALAMAVACFQQHTVWFVLLAPAISLPLVLGLAWWARRDSLRLRQAPEAWSSKHRLLLAKLHASQLAERLAAGEITGNESFGMATVFDRFIPQGPPFTDRVNLLSYISVVIDSYLTDSKQALNSLEAFYWVFVTWFMVMIFSLDAEVPVLAVTDLGFCLMWIGYCLKVFLDRANILSRYLHEAWDTGGCTVD